MTETTDYTWYLHELGKYRVQESRWGNYTSILEDGTDMVTGATEEGVRVVTEYIHLPFHYGSDTSDIKTTTHGNANHVDL